MSGPSISLGDLFSSVLLVVKTGFTPEITLRKSRVEGGWDLASPYVVCPCLHAQWSHILGLVGGGDTVAQKTVRMFACFALNHPNPDNC